MVLMRNISLLAMGLFSWAMLSAPLYAQTAINYQVKQDRCPIIAERRE